MILDFPIIYKNAPVLCQSECACLHQTLSMVVFFSKNNKNASRKGGALMQMYRIVPQTKSEFATPGRHIFLISQDREKHDTLTQV